MTSTEQQRVEGIAGKLTKALKIVRDSQELAGPETVEVDLDAIAEVLVLTPDLIAALRAHLQEQAS